MQVLLDDDLGRLTLRRLCLWHLLLAAGRSPVTVGARQTAARLHGHAGRPHVPVYRPRISQHTAGLAELAGRLTVPGPVSAQGVAMVTRMFADGTGPVYRKASADDLGVIIERASAALSA